MISAKLREWYQLNKRDLPWRETSDPYIIWISEIMLQQTRVAQGHDYFVRFTNRFPEVRALAGAPEDEVLKHWEGLGYYSRARNLHATAKRIVAEFDGKFPTDYEQVLSLKGVGEYTAAAIVSLAFNQPYAVVDGNVYRVLSRLFSLDTPIDTTKGKNEFYELATRMMDAAHAAEHNQAMMEFGALHCVPRNPDCASCIFADNCQANAAGTVSVLPRKQGKTKVRARYLHYFHVRNAGGTYLSKRPPGDIWQGLYEFPLIETEAPADLLALERTTAFRELFAGCEGLHFRSSPVTVKHVLSHQILHASFYQVEVGKAGAGLEPFMRVSPQNLNDYAIPRLLHIYLEKREGKLAE